ncbi:hypothetical protein [Streptomyces sp. NPDC055642]
MPPRAKPLPGAESASLLHLPVIPTPPEVAHVEGCSCNGLDWHLENCTIFTVPKEEAKEAIAAAHQRLQEHTDALNRQLHSELAALKNEKPK